MTMWIYRIGCFFDRDKRIGEGSFLWKDRAEFIPKFQSELPRCLLVWVKDFAKENNTDPGVPSGLRPRNKSHLKCGKIITRLSNVIQKTHLTFKYMCNML